MRNLPPGNTHGGVMIYYNNSLALRERPDLENQLNTLVCKISINNKKFDSFASNFDKMCKTINKENPHCAIHLGDYNAHSSEWRTGDDTD